MAIKPNTARKIKNLEATRQKGAAPLMWIQNLFIYAALLGGMGVMPMSAKADGTHAAAFMKHITSLRNIVLNDGPNDITFFGSALSGSMSQSQNCTDGCPTPGVILQYKEHEGISFDYNTYVPVVWVVTGGHKTMSLVNINDPTMGSSGGPNDIRLPGTIYFNNQGASKTINFYQAKYDSQPVTLMFVAEEEHSGCISKGSFPINIYVLSFSKSNSPDRPIYAFEPLLSYSTTKYNDTRWALQSEFGLQEPQY